MGALAVSLILMTAIISLLTLDANLDKSDFEDYSLRSSNGKSRKVRSYPSNDYRDYSYYNSVHRIPETIHIPDSDELFQNYVDGTLDRDNKNLESSSSGIDGRAISKRDNKNLESNRYGIDMRTISRHTITSPNTNTSEVEKIRQPWRLITGTKTITSPKTNTSELKKTRQLWRLITGTKTITSPKTNTSELKKTRQLWRLITGTKKNKSQENSGSGTVLRTISKQRSISSFGAIGLVDSRIHVETGSPTESTAIVGNSTFNVENGNQNTNYGTIAFTTEASTFNATIETTTRIPFGRKSVFLFKTKIFGLILLVIITIGCFIRALKSMRKSRLFRRMNRGSISDILDNEAIAVSSSSTVDWKNIKVLKHTVHDNCV